MSKIEDAVSLMERMANDDSYGYLFGGWGPKDFDCGHAIIYAWEKAGVPLKTKGASYTGDLKPVALSCGFKDITGQINLKTGENLARGDILVNTIDHAAMYCGNGMLVHARSAEGNAISGDQSGNEFRIQPYFNYPWNSVLRYQESETESEKQPLNGPVATVPAKKPIRCLVTMNVLQKGDTGLQVKLMQTALIHKGYKVGIDGADGDFGMNTELALKRFQREKSLDITGKCSLRTWDELVKNE